MRRVAAAVLRWAGPPAVALALAWPTAGQRVVDYPLFARTGTALLSGRLGEVYADPTNQGGPLELALFAIVHLLDGVRPALGQLLLPSAGAAVVAVLLVAGARRLRVAAGLPPAPALEAGAALLAALWGACQGPLLAGHPAELLVPVAWLAAGSLARSGSAVAAGLLVAVAAATEPWGLLGLPILLLGPALRGAVVAVAGAAAAYLPFAVSGAFALPRYRWTVHTGSLVHALAPGLTGFGWPLRLAQGALALGAGTAVAVAARRACGPGRRPGPDALWLVPLAVTAGRLVLDPVASGYYWWTALLLALAGVPLARRPAAATAAVALALAWWNAVDAGRTPLGALLGTVPLVAVAAAAPLSGGQLAIARRIMAAGSRSWYRRSVRSIASRNPW